MHAPLATASQSRHAPQPASQAEPARGHLRFITCGSVDDGKSTLIGRLLYDCRQVLDDQIATLEKDSKRYGTQADDLDFALLVDGLAAEREQGITIDVAYRYFSTGHRSFIVADTPGHEQYTRNMATGASTADLAILLIDARNGPTAQTRRHAFIVAMLGIRHIVLAVNKMDLVDYSQRRYETVTADFMQQAGKLGFASVVSIPLSAKLGEFVSTPSANMPWYRGRTLLDHLETVDTEPTTESTAFRFPVQWVSRPNSEFRGYSGFIASGTVSPGAAITVLPSGERAVVDRVLLAERELERAGAGQSVTLTLTSNVDISRGDVIVAGHDAATVTQRARADLFWMSQAPLVVGRSYLVKLGTRTTAAAIVQVNHTVDVYNYGHKPNADVSINDLASVTIAFETPVALSDYRSNRELGGFVVIDRATNDTVALGLIDRPQESTGRAKGAVFGRSVASLKSLRTQFTDWLTATREAPLRSFAKAVTWRTTGSVDTFILSFLFTGSAKISAAISSSEILTKLFLYYAHERLWARSRFGLRKKG